MKLYTRPRPLTAGLLRDGDQLALRPDGHPVQTPAHFIDLDLRGKIRWTTVGEVQHEGHAPALTVHHADGQLPLLLSAAVIVREVVELDPWTYVDRRPEPRPEDMLPTREVRRPQ